MIALLADGSRRRWLVAGLLAPLAAAGTLWAYDTIGYRNALDFEERHAHQPATALSSWQAYQDWHPTRHVMGASSADEEAHRLSRLRQQVREQDRDSRLAELQQQAADPDVDPEALWQRFVQLKVDHPELNGSADIESLRAMLKSQRDRQWANRSARAFAELEQSAQRTGNLAALVAEVDRFLEDYPGSAQETLARQLRQALVLRLDEQDIEPARRYSAQHPLNFQTRRELYQRYLDQHPGGGTFSAEARQALQTIAAAWDRRDFRGIRDHFVNQPGDLAELVLLCRRYLAVHPQGKFRASAEELLRLSEQVTVAREYRVTLRNGSFDKSIARLFSKGPKLSVELEVNGIRYGPSTIVYNEYEPVWDFEFPRPIRWKVGEPVIVRVKEHSWTDRIIAEFAAYDPLAMQLLNCRLGQGESWIQLQSDFRLPVMPPIE